jgi:diguanylate cyclase (GGDEF)-like protein/PAS domain S-box-containing protein
MALQVLPWPALILRPEGTILCANRAAGVLLERAPAKLRRRNLRELASPEEGPKMERLLAGEDGLPIEGIRMMAPGGKEIWLRILLAGATPEGDDGCLLAVLSSPPSREESGHSRPVSEARWDWDRSEGRVTCSPEWCSLLGYKEKEAPRTLRAWVDLLHPDDQQAFQYKLEALLSGEAPDLEHELRMRGADGEYRWLLTRVEVARDSGGKAARLSGRQREVGEEPGPEKGAIGEGFRDSLTGLPTRALLLDRLDMAMARARRRTDHLFAVLSVGLDRFRLINEGLGYAVGDQLLQEVARRLEACRRGCDTVARTGGDEIGILLDDIRGVRDATAFAERLQQALRAPVVVEGHDLFTSGSIGIVLSSPSYHSAEEMLRDADIAMHRAKGMGRGRYALFDTSMYLRTVEILELETELRRAVEQSGFRLHYQPIVSLLTGRIAGFEALIRWTHPTRGPIKPSEFIPLAEETGLIVPMGRWALESACKQLKSWLARFPQNRSLWVSVNVSGIQLLQPELIMQIDLALRGSGLAGRNLKLELTESVIMENAQYAYDMMVQLRAQEIRLCIDDFGTGYSSMSYLRRYPVDALKIDQSFVSRMEEDEESREIVRSVLQMGKSLKMEVIAEGVETAGQRDLLKRLGCELGQGFFFHRPLEAEAVESLLASKRSG